MRKIKELVVNIGKAVKHELGSFKRNLKFEQELKSAKILKIIKTSDDPEEYLYQVTPERKESLPMIKIFGINEEGIVNKIAPELNMYRFKDAMINIRADWIIKGNQVVWDKYFDQQFDITIACDYGVLKAKDGQMLLKKEVLQNEIVELENVFSLGGVQSEHWGHFSLQHLPKLYEVPKILQILGDEKLTILLPNYKDLQIKKIVYDYLENYSNVEIVVPKLNENIMCKQLFYMNKASYIMEHSRFSTRASWNLTTYSADALKNNLLKNIEEYDDEKNSKKIYLDRPTGMHRVIENREEIKDFFVSEGFTVIADSAGLSLEEKIKLFRNATFLAGPEGTAFMNSIFCKKGTRILKFASFITAENETLSGFYDKHWGTKTAIVCAYNDGKGEPHENFYIPLDRIKQAYYEMN